MRQDEIFLESIRQVAKLCGVALSISVSHKNIFFDKKMPEMNFPT
jgi:hypothetical protein